MDKPIRSRQHVVIRFLNHDFEEIVYGKNCFIFVPVLYWNSNTHIVTGMTLYCQLLVT